MPLLTRRKNLTPVLGHTVLNLTVLGAVSIPVPAGGATKVLIKVEDAPMRWRDDGVDPTASVGMLVATNEDPFLYEGDFSVIRMIRATVVDSKVFINYYK